MDGSIPTSISAQDLYGSIGTAVAPVVVDVRGDAAFVADDRMIAGAIRRIPRKWKTGAGICLRDAWSSCVASTDKR
jgi:hypothetical protein